MQLMTKEIEGQLLAADRDASADQKRIVVKYFTPDAQCTWFITEGQHTDDDWLLFGFCDLGDPQMAELGYLMLSELEAIRGPLGLRVERDLHFESTLADVLRSYGKL